MQLRAGPDEKEPKKEAMLVMWAQIGFINTLQSKTKLDVNTVRAFGEKCEERDTAREKRVVSELRTGRCADHLSKVRLAINHKVHELQGFVYQQLESSGGH